MNGARNAGWPVLKGGQADKPLTLPAAPKVARRLPVIDCCPICSCLHMTVEDFNACKARGREQV